jgi:predicted nucleic acid-binding protein
MAKTARCGARQSSIVDGGSRITGRHSLLILRKEVLHARPFALIAYFRDEPGAEIVENMLVTAGKKDTSLLMTDVNYAEVKYSIIKRDGAEAWAEAARVLEGLSIEFCSTTRALADAAADFKARFKISVADAFAAALAREKKAELVTGDPEFRQFEKDIQIIWLK